MITARSARTVGILFLLVGILAPTSATTVAPESATTVQIHDWTVKTPAGRFGIEEISYRSSPTGTVSSLSIAESRSYVFFYFGPLGKTSMTFSSSRAAARTGSTVAIIIALGVFAFVWWIYRGRATAKRGEQS